MNSYDRKWRHATFSGDTIGKEDNLTNHWTSGCVLELYGKRIVQEKKPLCMWYKRKEKLSINMFSFFFLQSRVDYYCNEKNKFLIFIHLVLHWSYLFMHVVISLHLALWILFMEVYVELFSQITFFKNPCHLLKIHLNECISA